MNKKIESLKELRAVVEQQPKDLAHGDYYNETTKQCCVVGHLLLANGAEIKDLIALDSDLYDANDYTISSIMFSARNKNIEEEKDFVSPIFTNLGFDLENDVAMFARLQHINDTTSGNKTKVIEAIDLEIERLENELNGN